MYRRLPLFLPIPLALVLGLLPATPSSGEQPRLAKVQSRLGAATQELGRKRRVARVLTGDVDRYNARIRVVQQRIDESTTRVARLIALQRREQTELDRIQRDLRRERARVARLRLRLAQTRALLARRLVELYETPKPDIVTVVMTARGFADLLERTTFLRRIADNDRQIVITVRTARGAAMAAARTLGASERRQATITQRVRARRSTLSAARQQLVGARAALRTTRDAKRRALSSVRVSARRVATEVRSLRRVEARIQRQLRAAQARNAPTLPAAGPLPRSGGSGRMIWPVRGPITSPFCERRSYEACHPGIDIAAPEGAPIRAAAAGRVVLLQSVAASGGYGNYTCVQHTASLSSCYAHQSRFGAALGQTVRQGQVIGYVGNTGRSFGAHLHWEVRVGGAIANPMSYV